MSKRLETVAAALAVWSLSASGCLAPSPDSPAEARLVGHMQALTSGPQLIATGVLEQTTDLAAVSDVDVLESGVPQNVLGGIGSALASAGGTTFLGLPDRGPNATSYTNGTPIDNTTSFVSRFETLQLKLSPTSSATLPFELSAKLNATTLLYSEAALTYSATPNLPSAVPSQNGAGKYYFSGRSDNFGAGQSTNPDFARLDPEGAVVSNDGNTVFVADEYGPYVYQFDRLTGRRLRSFALPGYFAVPNLNSTGAVEISGNSVGRVTNKGMEGLAITPDGSTLVGLMQSPLLQDGGDGGRANRIVTIDISTGATHEYVYDNVIGSKAYNSSEIIALNGHQFLIDTRDGKGLGDGSTAAVKQLWAVDIAGAADVSGLSGATALLARAVPKVLFLDLVTVLTANNIPATQIPAKIEGLAFGDDVIVNDVITHTLYIGNDNDFVPDIAGPNRWYVLGVTDEYLASLSLVYEARQITSRDADLSVTLRPSARTVVTGSAVGIAVSVVNHGLVPASNVSLTVGSPDLQVSACNAAAPATCDVQPRAATVMLSSLSGTASQTATVSATASCSIPDGTVIESVASVSFGGADPTAGGDVVTASIKARNPAPSINNLTTSKSILSPPNNKAVAVHVAYDISDNCPGTSCSLAVASNEPISEYGHDWTLLDAHNVLLRATRQGRGAGRAYTLTVSCRDSGGAVSTRSATVRVPKP